MARNWVMAPFDYSERAKFNQVWKYDCENNLISIGWNMGEFDSRDELRNKFQKGIEQYGWTKAGLSVLTNFWYGIKRGDRIIARGGRRRIIGVGTVTGSPFYNFEMKAAQGGDIFKGDHAYFLPVAWNEFKREFPSNKFSGRALYEVSDDRFNTLVDGLNPSSWEEFIERAKAYVDTGRLESEEIEYKVEIGKALSAARQAVMTGTSDWAELVRSKVVKNQNNLVHFTQLDNLRKWVEVSAGEALNALRAIWSESDSPVSDRIRAFSEQFPRSVTSGRGTRTNVISLLLMGLDVRKYPPFHITVFDSAFDQTGYGPPEQGADEAMLYEHALSFLDRFIEEAAKRGLTLRHRLDAQSVTWAIREDPRGDKDGVETPDDEDEPKPIHLQTLAKDVYLPVEFLEKIVTLLEDKKQVIFQGPPGTGKTYVAKALAKHLAGSEERVTLVQFHPSYAYEDFVQGFRPILEGGQAGFAIRDGPLLRAAKKAEADARKDPDAKHFMVIDEINRGNIAKVFGELYFLLEYRDEKMRLQYQGEDEDDFSLPGNLYVIGTMNTADRSIALVDLALRRRFYFEEFHPDDEPVKSVLKKWLDAKGLEGMAWVAAVVERINEKLQDDRHAAIGPSYFMKDGLDDAAVQRIWKHSVLPYIEERRFGGEQATDEFELAKLRQQISQAGVGEDADEQRYGDGKETANDGAQ